MQSAARWQKNQPVLPHPKTSGGTGHEIGLKYKYDEYKPYVPKLER